MLSLYARFGVNRLLFVVVVYCLLGVVCCSLFEVCCRLFDIVLSLLV